MSERLILPEPAGRTWAAHARTVAELLERTDRRARLLIGGGTILAARWGHRRSTDIDVVFPEVDGLDDWLEGGRLDIAERTGGELVKSEREHLTVKVEHGKLDIACYEPRPPGLERLEVLNGQRCWIMSTTQILRGNLGPIPPPKPVQTLVPGLLRAVVHVDDHAGARGSGGSG